MAKTKTNWNRITSASFIVSGVSLLTSIAWHAGAIDLLLGLYFFGALAGWISQRHGWLSGIIVGLPLALFQLTRLAAQEYGSFGSVLATPDFWALILPVSVGATGMAIIGALSGAWLQDMRLQRGN
jgi:hypothetical protein